MDTKKKICKDCKKESRIWKKGLCKSCALKLFPQKPIKKLNNTIKPKVNAPKPPIKKTPIKKKQNWIAKQSKKQIERQKKYQKLRDQYFLEHPICEFPGCKSKEIQLHHKAGRDGENLFNHFMSCCDYHHKYIHNNALESYEKGWLISRIKK